MVQSVSDFKRSINQVSKGIKRVNSFVPCAVCGKLVRRYPSQRDQAKRIFCSRKHMTFYYQGLHEWSNYNQHAFGVSLAIAESMLLGVDPWSLSEKRIRM